MKKQISQTQKALNIWAFILIIWSIYRSKFHFPIWFDEFIAKPIVFIFPVYWCITNREKKNFFSDIWLKTSSFFHDVYLSLGIGIIFALTALISNLVKHDSFMFDKTITTLQEKGLILTILIALATSTSEEILSRGFVLKRLFTESKNAISSIFISSILFFVLHIPILFTNLKLTGDLLLFFMITDLLLSLSVSFIYLQRKSLIIPILIHAFYNIAIMLYV